MAIRTASDKIGATVEAFGKLKTGQYGEFQSVLFQRHDIVGEAGQVWKSMKPADAKRFRRGQQVHLVPVRRDGKETFDIELLDGTAPPAPARTAAESPAKYNAPQLSKDQKFAIAAYLENRADLMAYCFQVTNQKLAALDPDSQRAAAIELYRSAINKFDL